MLQTISMRFFLCILLSLSFQFSPAQFLEKVYLKDSITIYQGWIIEQVPQEYLKMLRFKERDTITIEVGNVWKITREIDVKKINLLFQNPLEERKGISQAVFLELLGNGGIYSLNYDRRFKKGKRDGWGVRAGFGFLNISDSNATSSQSIKTLAIPVDVNYLFGKKKGAIEVGAGLTWFSSRVNGANYNFNNLEIIGGEVYNIQSNGFIGFLNIGYRRRSLNNGLMYKVVASPIIYPVFFLTLGFAIGYNFQKK